MLRRSFRRVTTAPHVWLGAGAAATAVLAIIMEGAARAVLGGPLKPAVMICQIFGWSPGLLWLGELAHYLLGLAAFPAAFVLLRPLLPGAALSQGLIWGAILWLGAAVVAAPLAGMPLFFGGGSILFASLVAHLAYGAVLGSSVTVIGLAAVRLSPSRLGGR